MEQLRATMNLIGGVRDYNLIMPHNKVIVKSSKYKGYPKDLIKLYTAEAVMLTPKLPGEKEARPRMTLKECEQYANAVVRSDYVRQRFIFNQRIKINDGRGSETGWAGFNEDGKPIIRLPRFARHKYYILHEVTHHIVGFNHGHDLVFRRTLLRLVGEEMGRQSYLTLKNSYLKHKVEFAVSKGQS